MEKFDFLLGVSATVGVFVGAIVLYKLWGNVIKPAWLKWWHKTESTVASVVAPVEARLTSVEAAVAVHAAALVKVGALPAPAVPAATLPAAAPAPAPAPVA